MEWKQIRAISIPISLNLVNLLILALIIKLTPVGNTLNYLIQNNIKMFWAIMFFGDFISTVQVGSEYYNVMETNPVFKFVGLPGIFIINILYIIFISWVLLKLNKP